MDPIAIARSGDNAAMKSALEAGLDANYVDPRGFSLLMIAAYSNQLEMTRLLLTNGADPNRQDVKGNTPLMGTAFKGYVEVAEALINGGANLELRNHDGQTALMMAADFWTGTTCHRPARPRR
jgi:ankyrin repeat protein